MRPAGQNGRRSRPPSLRDSNHRQQHSSVGPLAPVPAHRLASQEPPTIIRTDAQLAEMVEQLKAAAAFAFDSEFIGESNYQPRLCLVQTATSQRVFIVDPLAGVDLSGLWEFTPVQDNPAIG